MAFLKVARTMESSDYLDLGSQIQRLALSLPNHRESWIRQFGEGRNGEIGFGKPTGKGTWQRCSQGHGADWEGVPLLKARKKEQESNDHSLSKHLTLCSPKHWLVKLTSPIPFPLFSSFLSIALLFSSLLFCYFKTSYSFFSCLLHFLSSPLSLSFPTSTFPFFFCLLTYKKQNIYVQTEDEEN